MSDEKRLDHTAFTLPSTIISKIDVSRLVSEAERVDNALTTDLVRSKIGAPEQAQQSTFSDQLSDFLQQNKIQLTTGNQRAELIAQLRLLKDAVPVIHMTFASTADPDSLQQITQWLRTAVHPQAVIKVGLQPALVAGMYMRTPNRVFDMSLRAKLQEQRSMLKKELAALRTGGAHV